MEAQTVTTPTHSPTRKIHTPNTPKHGFSDSWEPYSPRKSARISQRNNNHNKNARTPSPGASNRQISFGSPRARKNKLTSSTSSSISMTPSDSPQKKRVPAMTSTRGSSANPAFDSTASLADLLSSGSKNNGGAGALGLLPTPSKTPQQTTSPRTKANVDAIRRNLFHQHEDNVMPTPKRKKHMLDSFDATEEDDRPIPIFTDSHERIPEVDTSEDNPFNGPPTAAASETPRRTKRQLVTVPGEGKITIEEAVKREDGMLTVFRGKRQFRKFATTDDTGSTTETLDAGDGGLEAAVESRLRRPLTRSSIKPRLLFPAAPAPVVQPQPANLDDEEAETEIDEEEAETDIEQPIAVDGETDEAEEEQPKTPADLITSKIPGTPAAPKFAPASMFTPPTTQRTTRQGSKSADEATPMKSSGRGKKTSPFDSWRRTRNASEGSTGTKRSGGSLTADTPKRTRA